jgi:hypothetical protein
MSTDNQNIPEEIDLGLLVKKINGFFGSISFSIFKGILFLKKKALILASLIIIGAALGTYQDETNNIYKNEILVSPNLGSTDYLYSKIELLSSKLSEKDKNFFHKIGIDNIDNIISIEIDPIIDIYEFVNKNTAIATNAQNTQNFELMKLLAESSDINKVLNDKLTSKNYPRHLIKILTKGTIQEKKIINPLLKFLNSDSYYAEICKVTYENSKAKIQKNTEIIKQLDSLIGKISDNLTENKVNSNLIYNNDNNQLEALFNLKDRLIVEISNMKVELINLKDCINYISITTNVKYTKGVVGKMKLIVPFLFIFLFIFLSLFISFYKKQAAKLT